VQGFVTGLLQIADRATVSKATTDSRTASIEAMITVCGNLPADCYPILLAVAEHVLPKIGASIVPADVAAAATTKQMKEFAHHSGVLCALASATFRNLKKDHVQHVATPTLEGVMALFHSPAGDRSGVQDDGVMLVGTIIEKLGADFSPYLPVMLPAILAGATQMKRPETSKICIGVIGDLMRYMGVAIIPHADMLLQAVMGIVQIPDLDVGVKAAALSVFGDAATAVGPEVIGPYCTGIMAAVNHAANEATRDVPADDMDAVEAQDELREGCLECYTELLMALKGGKWHKPYPNAAPLLPHLPYIVMFLSCCMADANVSERVLRDGVGLVGDFISVFGSETVPVLPLNFCQDLLRRTQSGDPQTRRNSRYAQQMMQQAGIAV
jgi:importin subunit beta-1